MKTRAQRNTLLMVVSFGLGVLLTLECVEADAHERIAAARRAALDCRDHIAVGTTVQPAKLGGRS